MTHSYKLKQMQRHLASVGVPPTTSAPPLWRLLWRLGIQIPPPLFTRFLPLALFMGILFGAFWGLFMWLFLWSRQSIAIGIILGASAVAGLLFGLCMADYFRHLARKHHLPLWADYAGQQP